MTSTQIRDNDMPITFAIFHIQYVERRVTPPKNNIQFTEFDSVLYNNMNFDPMRSMSCIIEASVNKYSKAALKNLQLSLFMFSVAEMHDS